MTTNKQINQWKKNFGDQYTERNAGDLDLSYIQKYEISRSSMNNNFLGFIDRDIKILEVGVNRGLQIEKLKPMGFKNFYGIEINKRAINICKNRIGNINLVEASALEIPFKDNSFDLVFTSGVLIHISPDCIDLVMKEIYRVSKRFIWGFEYYSEKYATIIYRENEELLWKANFVNIYKTISPNLKIIKRIKYQYKENNNLISEMFLLSK